VFLYCNEVAVNLIRETIYIHCFIRGYRYDIFYSISMNIQDVTAQSSIKNSHQIPIFLIDSLSNQFKILVHVVFSSKIKNHGQS